MKKGVKDSSTSQLLEELKTEWNNLDLVERGYRLQMFKAFGCSNRELGRALEVDHKIISRDLRIAELPEDQRAQIAQGASAAPFLHPRRDQQKPAKLDASRQDETTNPTDSGVVEPIGQCQPDAGPERNIPALESLSNSVRQLEERISTLEISQANIVRGIEHLVDVQTLLGNIRRQRSQDEVRAAEEKKTNDFNDHWNELEKCCVPQRGVLV